VVVPALSHICFYRSETELLKTVPEIESIDTVSHIDISILTFFCYVLLPFRAESHDIETALKATCARECVKHGRKCGT
jgi:hypothetical protein